MAHNISVDRIVEACGDGAQDGGITIRTALEPLAGPGAPVKPAIYAGGAYQLDRRWWGDDGERRPVDAVVIDNVPSQANRLEAALEGLRTELGIPEIVLELSGQEPLPAHIPRRLSSFRFPHRQADAYLRDAMLDGAAFPKSEVGRAIFDATADRPVALLEWFPQALLFGFWQSHAGKRTQAKLARSWTSEIVGFEPASVEGKQLGLKGDPMNLSVEEIYVDPNDDMDWELPKDGKKPDNDRKRKRLADIGHGQVPVGDTLAAVSCREIRQQATVSFAGLRRVWVDAGETNALARALLVSLGLVAHVAAFGRFFSLRSGCDLRPVDPSWTWLGNSKDEPVEPPTLEDAISLFRACAERAEAGGLPVGGRWASEPLVLTPKKSLAEAIRSTYPLDE